MTPKTLNKEASAVFEKLIEPLQGTRHHIKYGNPGDAFMPAVIEKLDTLDIGTVYSIAHYYELNGDLCQDPEMTFIKTPFGIIPNMFQQALPPVYQESIFKDKGTWVIRVRLQADHVAFANDWMINIKNQQNIIIDQDQDTGAHERDTHDPFSDIQEGVC